MTKRHIKYISGTRADYGLIRNTLFEIAKHPNLKLSIIATGIHLMPEVGTTIDEIRRDGFDVHEIKATYKRDDRAAMSEFIGELIIQLTELFKEPANRPDLLLVLGDRGEMLAAAVVGGYLGIPIAHIHGGDVTSTVDEASRHAITKLAHIHLPATSESAERIIKMGQEKKHVYVVGAPGLDEIRKLAITKKEVEKILGIKLDEKYAIITQHPVTEEISLAKNQMKETIEAVLLSKLQAIITYPNADAGGRAMIKVIEEYANNSKIKIFKNILHDAFLGLMKYASVMIGNSSSGIIEAASFKLPVVNIGTRQEGRQRTYNVIDAGYDRKDIASAINKALNDKKFIAGLGECKNPYGDGKTGSRIAKILADISLAKGLLQKKMTY